ncbi:MAG: hypothetical protein ABSG92_04665 [Conexivisphaerales archaeon]
MKRDTVVSLAIVLFKSYFRASRAGRRSTFSNPNSIFAIDAVVFVVPFALIWYFLPQAPQEIVTFLAPLTAEAVVGLPVILISGVILAGVLFELGTASGLASSEAVNWLPVTPREYVVASCLSLDFAYSPLLAFGLGAVLPLAAGLGFSSVIPSLVALSFIAFFWGAVIVEAIRSLLNRISMSVNRRSGRLGTILRIVLVIALLVVFQLAFQPTVLYIALSDIVNGVSLAWFVPMVWPSVALVAELSSDLSKTASFLALTALFTVVLFEVSAMLRSKYWSPVPVITAFASSPVYVPQGRSFLWLDPVSYALAIKDLRSLTRRREMSRFLAIPVLLVVVFLLPSLYGGGLGADATPFSLYLLGEVSTLLPIMLSSISLGQEGRSVANLYMLPMSPDELIMGKLFLPWVFTGAAVAVVASLMQLLFPMPMDQFAVVLVALAFIVFIQAYVGLGTGARHPDFTLGPRARYVTGVGFLVAFAVGALSTLVMFLPLMASMFLSVFSSFGLGSTGTAIADMVLTASVGVVLLLASRAYCRSGVEKFLSDMLA